MNKMERLKRIDVLLDKIIEQPILATDKTFDRIGYHITLLDKEYNNQSLKADMSNEELSLVMQILRKYNSIQETLSQDKKQMMVDRNMQRNRSTKIQNGYLQKSIAFQSKHINNYK